MLTICIFTFLCMFATQSYATEIEEFSEGSLNYIILQDDTVKITKYHGDGKNYTIPSKIDGKSVSVIGRYSFMHAEKLEKLVIPGSIREIEDQGIEECYALKTVVINKGKLKIISSTCIENCHNLKSVSIPKNVESVGTLLGCEKLKEFNVNENNPYICSVDGVVFSKDKTVLLKYPQGRMTDEYVVPASVETIAGWAFYDARLTKVFVPKTVETVEETAFGYCSAEIYTDAAKAPKKWKDALVGRIVYYKQPSKAEKITVGKVGKLSCTQTSSTITLKWKKADSADGYRVYKYNDKTKKYEKLKDVTCTSLKISKLKSGTVYKFKVRAFARCGKKYVWGSYSDVLQTATKTKAPVLSKLTAGSKRFTATWKTVSGATGYEVVYSTSKKFTKKTTKTVTIKKAKTKKTTIKKLKKGKKYYVKVRAYKTVSGKKIYGAYSSVKSLKVK